MVLIGCLIVVGVVTWFVASEGIWGAASQFVCVLLAGLLAMNFFEPLAQLMESALPDYDAYYDLIALLGLFAGFTFGLRALAERLVPTEISTIELVDTVGRYAFGLLTGYLTMAILLTSLHTAPLPRTILDFAPEKPTVLGTYPDRQWLALTQYISEHFLAQYIFLEPDTGKPIPKGFDGLFNQFGKGADAYPNRYWSSFPIRYAWRREQLDQGGGGAPPPPKPVVAPVAPPAGGNVGF